MRIIESVLFICPILCGPDQKEWRSLPDQITLSCVREAGIGFLMPQDPRIIPNVYTEALPQKKASTPNRISCSNQRHENDIFNTQGSHFYEAQER